MHCGRCLMKHCGNGEFLLSIWPVCVCYVIFNTSSLAYHSKLCVYHDVTNSLDIWIAQILSLSRSHLSLSFCAHIVTFISFVYHVLLPLFILLQSMVIVCWFHWKQSRDIWKFPWRDTSSLSMDAVFLSHCYKVLSDPIWWELDEQMSKISILYINALRWVPSHASVGYSLRPTHTSSLSIDAMCLSHCYKVLSDPIWWELDE